MVQIEEVGELLSGRQRDLNKERRAAEYVELYRDDAAS